jgi:hypothetical protein
MTQTVRWKKAGMVLYLTAFLIAATSGALIAEVRNTVTVSNSTCDQVGSGNSTCSSCIVDFGYTGVYCWSSKCDNQLLGYRACLTNGAQKNPCVSAGACWTTCNNCNGWQCTKLNPPDDSHKTYWCDINNCLCPDKAADWTGSWNQWPTCIAS